MLDSGTFRRRAALLLACASSACSDTESRASAPPAPDARATDAAHGAHGGEADAAHVAPADGAPRLPADGAPRPPASTTTDAALDAALDSALPPPADALPDSPRLDASAATHRFRKIVLTTSFYAEGAAHGDFDRDGASDVVSGPYWYKGPDFTTKFELYTPVAFDPKSYSDCFFDFVHDMNADGWDDVLIVGYPGKDASWLENPGRTGGAWKRHRAVDVVDDESPDFVDLTGDGKPELVFANGGRLGWATPSPTDPTAAWTFHALSPAAGFMAFTHGLGVGDVDGDGRADVLETRGYWEQPKSLTGDPAWTMHAQTFGSGGAQMLVSDVDGDGDSDVITSLAAHEYGISWFEQVSAGAPFVEHVIVSSDPATADVVIFQPHAEALADIDGDGMDDIVTGERFWGHVPAGQPDFNAPARLYWLQRTRDATGVHFVPHLVDDASGVGTQVVVGDVTGDGLPDVVVGNKKGAFVFVHELASPSALAIRARRSL